MGGVRTLNGPQGGLAFDLEAADNVQFGQPQVPPARAIAGPQTGTELLEHYWASLLRDVAFTDYDSSSLAAMAAEELSGLSANWYTGPRNSSGQVTPDMLFSRRLSRRDIGTLPLPVFDHADLHGLTADRPTASDLSAEYQLCDQLFGLVDGAERQLHRLGESDRSRAALPAEWPGSGGDDARGYALSGVFRGVPGAGHHVGALESRFTVQSCRGFERAPQPRGIPI